MVMASVSACHREQECARRPLAVSRNGDCLVEAILDSLEFTEAADFPTLTEYRLGQTSGIGDGDGVHLLSWV